MKVRFVVAEDFVNYKKCSMFIGYPYCSLKCEKDCGIACCQNSALFKQPILNVNPDKIVEKYLSNPISSAIVFGGLEPFDSWDDLIDLVKRFREVTEDDIVIYTGYNEDEILSKIVELQPYKNIIIKFGRFIPNQKFHHDPILGVELASDNQYSKYIS